MFKKQDRKVACFVLLVFCAIVFVSLCGCETARGLGRDVQNADKWFRENAW
jgi:predicted small secreted protein